nr:hypothetical protein CFP56_16830 [Quercus suber]
MSKKKTDFDGTDGTPLVVAMMASQDKTSRCVSRTFDSFRGSSFRQLSNDGPFGTLLFTLRDLDKRLRVRTSQSCIGAIAGFTSFICEVPNHPHLLAVSPSASCSSASNEQIVLHQAHSSTQGSKGRRKARMAVSVPTASPTVAEDEQLLVQISRLRDAVLAGKHTQFRLSASAIAQLTRQQNGMPNVNAHAVTTVDNQQQKPPQSSQNASNTDTANGLLELRAVPSGLDPIFLQKSQSLVRAEGVMKRQRIERELELQVEQRKRSARDKDHGHEGLFSDVNAILLSAIERVKPVSGLKPAPQPPMTTASSFDENDYYSSHVHTDWSSEASSSKGSDKEADASIADISHRHSHAAEFSTATLQRSQQQTVGLYHSTHTPEDVLRTEEDDEYTPPDAAAFDASFKGSSAVEVIQPLPLDDDMQHDDDDDDDDDYEPGEIMHGGTAQASNIPVGNAAAPVIRNNHLTHIAAPQPNRVSPLATAKGPSIELELINGRPEVVRRLQTNHRAEQAHSRASTGSPVNNGGAIGKNARKRAKQKRKRQSDHEVGRDMSARKRRDQQRDARSPITPIHTEPYIKPEPLSPPPLQQSNGAPAYLPHLVHRRSNEIDLVSPQNAPLSTQYTNHAPRSALRHEYAPQSPGLVRLGSPAGLHSAKRDSQDLRRVASLHHAQRPSSPYRTYTPITPYRAISHAYGQYPQSTLLPAPADVTELPRHHESRGQPSVQYVQATRPRSPTRIPDYQGSYQSRAQTPALMLPPPPRKIIVDQYGQRYYAAEPVPASDIPRASVAPIEQRVLPDAIYDAAPIQAAYGRPSQTMQYDPTSSRTPLPPTLPRGVADYAPDFIDPNGHRYREYSSRPAETVQHAGPRRSPVYQQIPRYEHMPPPQAPTAREQTSPVYAPPRAYSVRPEESQQLQQYHVMPNHLRQASAAPVQYVRQEAPHPSAARAISVVPSADYGATQDTYSYPPANVPQVKYIDQYGRPVQPSDVRQPNEYRYM